jgi:hypothetical protein
MTVDSRGEKRDDEWGKSRCGPRSATAPFDFMRRRERRNHQRQILFPLPGLPLHISENGNNGAKERDPSLRTSYWASASPNSSNHAYSELGHKAGIKALLDAQINYDGAEIGVACYCYGDTTSGQRIFYQFGMSSIPIYNTNNACATGSQVSISRARSSRTAPATAC